MLENITKVKRTNNKSVYLKNNTYLRAQEFADKNGYKLTEFVDIAIRKELERRESGH